MIIAVCEHRNCVELSVDLNEKFCPDNRRDSVGDTRAYVSNRSVEPVTVGQRTGTEPQCRTRLNEDLRRGCAVLH